MRDDVRKLMGGYATGSLTEAERKLLFEAALDDQELFEELAREDALRELLAAPGAKQRMIAALEKPKSAPWWTRPWSWVVAGAGAAGVIVAMVYQTAPKPAQIALQQQVARSPEIAAVREAPQPKPVVPGNSMARAKVARQESKVDEIAEKKAEAQPSAQALNNNDAATARGAIAAAAPAPPAASVAERSAFRLKDAKAGRFAFDYALDDNGRLRITPVADGYLSVEFVSGDEVETAPGIGQNGRVQAGTPVSVQVPNYANAVSIRFAVTPGQKPGEALGRRDALAGTVEDPNPSLDSRLVIQLRLPARK